MLHQAASHRMRALCNATQLQAELQAENGEEEPDVLSRVGKKCEFQDLSLPPACLGLFTATGHPEHRSRQGWSFPDQRKISILLILDGVGTARSLYS